MAGTMERCDNWPLVSDCFVQRLEQFAKPIFNPLPDDNHTKISSTTLASNLSCDPRLTVSLTNLVFPSSLGLFSLV